MFPSLSKDGSLLQHKSSFYQTSRSWISAYNSHRTLPWNILKPLPKPHSIRSFFNISLPLGCAHLLSGAHGQRPPGLCLVVSCQPLIGLNFRTLWWQKLSKETPVKLVARHQLIFNKLNVIRTPSWIHNIIVKCSYKRIVSLEVQDGPGSL